MIVLKKTHESMSKRFQKIINKIFEDEWMVLEAFCDNQCNQSKSNYQDLLR